MPIDVTQLIPQLRSMAERASAARRTREQRVARMRRVFTSDFDHTTWNSVCEQAAHAQGIRWTGALFNAGENANQFIPFGNEPASYVLIATDGSQIMPDRHKAVQYAVIQVASTCIVYGQPANPIALPDAVKGSHRKPLQFLSEDQLYDDNGELVSPGEISTERDLEEIELLAEQCEHFCDAGLQPVAVADGSLVPFSLLNELFLRNSPHRAGEQLDRVVKALNRIRDCGAIVTGYIDRPNSNAVARACALAEVQPDAVSGEPALRETVRKAELNLRGILDRHVLDQVLPPSHRTALFEPSWLVNDPQYLGRFGHTMRCCYLNVSSATGPARTIIARLEMPAWCSNAENIGITTAVLGRHARMGGGYPLCLKAAHEEAVLSHTEEKEIDLAIERGLIEEGIFMTPSSKQEAKDRR